jgi:hypothetical protein
MQGVAASVGRVRQIRWSTRKPCEAPFTLPSPRRGRGVGGEGDRLPIHPQGIFEYVPFRHHLLFQKRNTLNACERSQAESVMILVNGSPQGWPAFRSSYRSASEAHKIDDVVSNPKLPLEHAVRETPVSELSPKE